MDPVWLALPGLFIWSAVLAVPWRPWSTRESLDATGPAAMPDLSDVTVLIPARNERETIAATLQSVALQGQNHRILLVDDQSSDGTSAEAGRAGVPNLAILAGQAPEPGWTGKLWALEQGRRAIRSPYILLLDADIELRPGTLPALIEKLRQEHLGLASLMARLRMVGFWERLLMPAFIYFFKLLYPFRLANSGFRPIAAAAGGCILIRRDALDQIGGFAALRGELIDDCALARKVKRAGHRTWIGLTHSAISHRRYPQLQDVWDMVARTAYSQLRHSPALLLVCSAALLAAFLLPVASLVQGGARPMSVGVASLMLMCASYMPILKYYNLSVVWSPTMPVAGLLFLLMTWTSAWRSWSGSGAAWKGRHYHGPSRS